MNENELISIVIPVYNSEKYLAECIDSILAQTYSNIEVLLINDGSKDRSGDICQDYARRDKRVIYIPQTNQGVSAARNAGINHASGKYLMFVDSDDTIAENMVDEMYRKATESKAQLVIGGLLRTDQTKGENRIQDNIISGKAEIANLFFDNYLNFVASSPCCKLSLLQALGNIRFREGMALGEDLLFNVSLFENVEKIAIVNKEFYYYRIENGTSLTNTYKDGYYKNMRFLYEKAYEYLKRVEHESGTVINKSNIGYKFYYFAVAFIVRQIERGDSKNSCKRYIETICNDSKFIEAVSLISEVSVVDRMMMGLIKRKRIGLIYNAALIRSKVRRL